MTHRTTHPTTHPTTHGLTCTECLRLVATADVHELTTATAVTEHCRTCADCATVVDEVGQEAQRLADTLDGTLPGVPAHVVALRAVAGAAPGRRRTRRLRTALSAGAVTVALLGTVMLLRTSTGAAAVETRTVELHCLAPEQAAELVRPLMTAQIEVTFRPTLNLPVLMLRGPHRDLALAEQQIAQIDARWGAERSAYCAGAPRTNAPAPEVVGTPPR
ncbi:MAG: hypothetical protein ACXWZS_12365 [Gemmatirosa sp.]